MFGHGQIEGYTERYGMDFKQARLRESANEGLIARHQEIIAPLLKNRQLFAESTNFVLYDFWTGYGKVNENVFAYSNMHERSARNHSLQQQLRINSRHHTQVGWLSGEADWHAATDRVSPMGFDCLTMERPSLHTATRSLGSSTCGGRRHSVTTASRLICGDINTSFCWIGASFGHRRPNHGIGYAMHFTARGFTVWMRRFLSFVCDLSWMHCTR